ncbi:MAG: pyruvate kinase [Anaerolineae bacterium]|nr:pyruvate kinase [Anaerolineae bacterium]
MLNTKIVCTIGPATDSVEAIRALMRAGMDVVRLNMSHGTHEYHAGVLAKVRSVARELDKPVGILVDLQGPKLRVGKLPDGGVMLEPGVQVELCTATDPSRTGVVPVQFKALPRAVQPGDRVLLDDGALELQVEDTDADSVMCRVVVGGVLTSNKGMNLPRASLAIAAVTPKDEQDLDFALAHSADWIALSFVRRAEEVVALKELIRQRAGGGRLTPVIAKIEKPEAMEVIDEIIAVVDGIMVARGDLGIEVSPEAVPMMQKMIIAKCNQVGVPVITATQMLDSMIRNPRPTRAEASDVANAILDGTDAIMLSGETAVGKYPVKSVETMVRIAQVTESHWSPDLLSLRGLPMLTNSQAVCHAAADMAVIVRAKAILAPTISGSTAKTLSWFRPPSAVIAITPDREVEQMLTLYWGVHSLHSHRAPDTDSVIQDALETACQAGLLQAGDTAVITAGTGGDEHGVTDLIKVHTLPMQD